MESFSQLIVQAKIAALHIVSIGVGFDERPVRARYFFPLRVAHSHPLHHHLMKILAYYGRTLRCACPRIEPADSPLLYYPPPTETHENARSQASILPSLKIRGSCTAAMRTGRLHCQGQHMISRLTRLCRLTVAETHIFSALTFQG